MTRKDYIAIAGALRKSQAGIPEMWNVHLRRGVLLGAEHIADVMQADNPRFDREHFLAVIRGERELQSRPSHMS